MIISQPPTPEYRDGWERIYGKRPRTVDEEVEYGGGDRGTGRWQDHLWLLGAVILIAAVGYGVITLLEKAR